MLYVSASNCVCCRLRKRVKGCFCDIGFFVTDQFSETSSCTISPPPPLGPKYLAVFTGETQRSLVEMLPAENRDQIRIRLNHCGSGHKISCNSQLIRTSLWASEAGNGVWQSSCRRLGLVECPKIAVWYKYKPRGTRMLRSLVPPVNNWIKKGIESDQVGRVLMIFAATLESFQFTPETNLISCCL